MTGHISTFAEITHGFLSELGLSTEHIAVVPDHWSRPRLHGGPIERMRIYPCFDGLPVAEMEQAGAEASHDAMVDELREWARKMAPVINAICALGENQ